MPRHPPPPQQRRTHRPLHHDDGADRRRDHPRRLIRRGQQIEAGVPQHHGNDAPPCAGRHPRQDERSEHQSQHPADDAGAHGLIRRVEEERRSVPDDPDHGDQHRRPEHRDALREHGEQPSAPPGLLAEAERRRPHQCDQRPGQARQFAGGAEGDRVGPAARGERGGEVADQVVQHRHPQRGEPPEPTEPQAQDASCPPHHGRWPRREPGRRHRSDRRSHRRDEERGRYGVECPRWRGARVDEKRQPQPPGDGEGDAQEHRHGASPRGRRDPRRWVHAHAVESTPPPAAQPAGEAMTICRRGNAPTATGRPLVVCRSTCFRVKLS